jgi:hypothetical protein
VKQYAHNHPMSGLNMWPAGTRWLQSTLFVFGAIKPPAPQPKTPLQIAADTLVLTQRELLDAKLEIELAEARVAMLAKRGQRLIRDVADLSGDQS